jgi:RecB family exonuclease
VPGALVPGRELSATSLEDYAACGFRYFCKSVLGIRAVSEPEEQDTMDAATRGTVVHRVLQRFFGEQLARGRPASFEPWTDADRVRVRELLAEELAAMRARGKAGLALYHAHDAAGLQADLDRFLREDSERRAASGARPLAFELPFAGLEAGGRRFRGSIDRVDSVGGGLLAIDYKTGGTSGYEVTEDDPFQGGIRLQLGIYSLAAERAFRGRASGRYWFISRRGDFETVDLELTEAQRTTLGRLIEAMGAGIEAGAFPAIPGDDAWPSGYEHCRFCDFDRVCSRRRDAVAAARAGCAEQEPWERVAHVARGDEGE